MLSYPSVALLSDKLKAVATPEHRTEVIWGAFVHGEISELDHRLSR